MIYQVWIEDSLLWDLLPGPGLWYKTVRWWHRVQPLYPPLQTHRLYLFFSSPCRKTERVETQRPKLGWHGYSKAQQDRCSDVKFPRMESNTFASTWLVRNNSSNRDCNLAFWSIFASARCLITVQSCEETRGKLHCTSPFMFWSARFCTFPKRQHNLRWEMSSCMEHDPRFHLPLKCLGYRRILAELAGLPLLWTHRDVGGYVSVITS